MKHPLSLRLITVVSGVLYIAFALSYGKNAEKNIRNLANPAPVMTLSSRSGDGMHQWFDWLHTEIDKQKNRVIAGETRKPAIQPDGVALHAQHGAGGNHHHHDHGDHKHHD